MIAALSASKGNAATTWKEPSVDVVAADSVEVSEADWGGPEARIGQALAFDPKRGVWVLFGGMAAKPLADTWEFDGTTWTKVEGVGPAARLWHGLAWDPVGEQVLLFGGTDSRQQLFDDTWAWKGRGWRKFEQPGPTARSHFAITTDPLRRRVVLFGGLGQGRLLADTWEFDGSTWKLAAVEGPAPRSLSAMAFDPAMKMCLLFGGKGREDHAYFDDSWVWGGVRWTRQLSPESPSPRFLHRLASDPTHEGVLLIGGGQGRKGKSEAWRWRNGSWKQLDWPAAPLVFPAALGISAEGTPLLLGGRTAEGVRQGRVYALMDDAWHTLP